MAIEITDGAVFKILNLTAGAAEKGLRVKVVGGGCSGLQYKMDVDEPKKGDKVFEREGAKIVIDRKSFLYLNGTVLDFQDSLMNTGFTLDNPNVKRSCGCGQSFSV